MNELTQKSAGELAHLIKRKEVSSKEVVEAHLDRIKEVNPEINAITVTLEESAVGLKILFGANRPAACDFQLYWKTGTADDDLNTLPWNLESEYSNNPADDDGTFLSLIHI